MKKGLVIELIFAIVILIIFGIIFLEDVSARTTAGLDSGAKAIESNKRGADIVIKQWGTTDYDSSEGVACDKYGSVYVTGSTYGNLDNISNLGSIDAYVRIFNSKNNWVQTLQWGTNQKEGSRSIAVDYPNFVVVGRTFGEFPGYNNPNKIESSFLSNFRINSFYNPLITLQWGPNNSVHQRGTTITMVNRHTFYMSGSYSDSSLSHLFLRKIVDSTTVWEKFWSSNDDDDASSHAHNSQQDIYVVGHTGGNLDGNTNQGGSDIFLTKFDGSGNKIWTKQWGTTDYDWGDAVKVDKEGNVYVSGWSDASLINNNPNAKGYFIRKYDSKGNELWTTQGWKGNYSFVLGKWTPNVLALSDNGNVYLAGYFDNNIQGIQSKGMSDVFLSEVDRQGKILWTKTWGTANDEEVFDIAVCNVMNGNVMSFTKKIYITGDTYGSLGSSNKGSRDGFLIIYTDNSEPLQEISSDG